MSPQVATPFWTDEETRKDAALQLAGIVALTLGTTGVCGVSAWPL
jgi:hypothetical protein